MKGPESEEVGLRCLDDDDHMEGRTLTCKRGMVIIIMKMTIIV